MSHETALLLGAAASDGAIALEERLRSLGVRVDTARLGMEVVERALFNRYDAIVLDTSMTLLDPRQVRELLRHNPRTQATPVFLVDFGGLGGLAGETNYIAQPLANFGWLEAVLPVRVKSSPEAEGTLHADLREIPLPDLIQMLTQNRRRGVLEVEMGERRGRIEIFGDELGGIQIDGGPHGLKALARMQGWSQGKARFQPQPALKPRDVEGHATTLLVESLRLRDEEVRWRTRIPAGSRLVYRPRRDAEVPSDPLHEQILLLVDFFGTVDDILERLDAADAAILGGIHQLAQTGWVDIVAPDEASRGSAASAWEDLELPSKLGGLLPQVWLFGRDAQYTRLLWADPRMQRRLIARRSLRSGGRFGGNGWIVDVGGGNYLWLRWSTPDPGLSALARRGSGVLAGVMMLVGEADGDDLDQFRLLAEDFAARGTPPVWLPIEPGWANDGAQVWRDEAWAGLPGRKLAPAADPLHAFWNGLREALAAAAGDPA